MTNRLTYWECYIKVVLLPRMEEQGSEKKAERAPIIKLLWETDKPWNNTRGKGHINTSWEKWCCNIRE